jgi:hypothetical protein
MSLSTPAFDQVRLAAPQASYPLRPGRSIAVLLAVLAAACLLLALKTSVFVARYDTLGFLLDEAHAPQMARLRTALLLGGMGLAATGIMALVRWRVSLAVTGLGLVLAGLVAGPLVRSYLAPQAGLEESLIYRLRGFSAIGTIAGLFLLFLSWLPSILERPAGRCERFLADRVRRGVARTQGSRALPRRIVLGLATFCLACGVGFLVLQDFPNSSDENSYLTQARIFATGRLWVQAPPMPDFFEARSFVMDEARGRFFAKAFPGWAAILSLGVRAGVPWALNPLLSAMTVILAGWAGAKLLGRHGELAVVGIIVLTPFFLLNAASYYNHPATALLVVLFLAATIRLAEGAGLVWAVLAGLASGAALWIRPGSALALTLPFFLWLGWKWLREGRWGVLVTATAPVLLALAGLALYNRSLFGSALRTGYDVYDPQDIRAGLGMDHLVITGWWLLKLLFWLVPGSLAGLFFLARGRGWREWFRKEPILVLMALSLAGLVLTYLLFQNKGGNEYGPRYYYDGLVYLAILVAAGWMRAPEALAGRVPALRVARAAALTLGFGAFLAVAGSIPFLMFHYHDKVAHNRDLFLATERSGHPSALVFLRTGSGRMPPGDLVRNPLDFRTGVVYARDLGPDADQMLAALYADRPALVYTYDALARRGTLRPFEEALLR